MSIISSHKDVVKAMQNILLITLHVNVCHRKSFGSNLQNNRYFHPHLLSGHPHGASGQREVQTWGVAVAIWTSEVLFQIYTNYFIRIKFFKPRSYIEQLFNIPYVPMCLLFLTHCLEKQLVPTYTASWWLHIAWTSSWYQLTLHHDDYTLPGQAAGTNLHCIMMITHWSLRSLNVHVVFCLHLLKKIFKLSHFSNRNRRPGRGSLRFHTILASKPMENYIH